MRSTPASRTFSAVLIAALGHFTVDFYSGMLPPLLPRFADKFGLSLAMAGAIMSVTSMVSSFSQPAFGYLFDRAGRLWPVALALGWASVLGGLVGLMPTYASLIGLVVLAGLGSAAFHPLGAILAAGAAGGRKSLAMSLFNAGGSLGFAVAPLVVVPLVRAQGLPAVYKLIPVGLVSLLAVLLAGVHRGEALKEHGGAVPLRTLLSTRPRTLVTLAFMMGSRAWAASAVVYAIPFLYRPALGEAGAGFLLTGYLLAGTFGGIAGGYLGDRFGVKTMVIASCLAAMPVLAWGLSLTGPAVWGVLLVGGAVAHMGFPSMVVLAQETLPANAAMASGLAMGFAFGVGGLGVILTGLAADRFGLLPAVLANLLLLVVSAMLAEALDRSSRLEQGLAVPQ